MAEPCVAVYITLPGDTVSEAAETVSATGIVRVTPPLITVIIALFVPTVAEDKATLVVIEPLPLPDDGLSVSQGTLLLAVQ